jgi:molybdate transport system ATP-binding protein
MPTELTLDFRRRFAQGPEILVSELRIAGGTTITVLFGPSGAGKTTILRCVAGIEKPDAGHIAFGGVTWFDDVKSICIGARRRGIGFVPQDYSLFPHLTVAENVAYGLNHISADARKARCSELLELLGISDLRNRMPNALSGGQQQRVSLARALAPTPRLLLLDEPFAAIDFPTRSRLRLELRQLLKKMGVPTVFVTHDRTEALAIADEMVIIAGGRNLQQGTPHEVFTRPVSIEAAGSVATETIIPGTVLERADLVKIKAGATTLHAVTSGLPADTKEVYACIRAEDVILVAQAEQHSSARNMLRGTIRSLTAEGPLWRADIECGFQLAALITKQSMEEMPLQIGSEVTALIKAPQIHLIPRSPN